MKSMDGMDWMGVVILACGVALVTWGIVGFTPANAGEGSPWRAIGEQQRQIDALTKQVRRLQTLPTNAKEEEARRRIEEARR